MRWDVIAVGAQSDGIPTVRKECFLVSRTTNVEVLERQVAYLAPSVKRAGYGAVVLPTCAGDVAAAAGATEMRASDDTSAAAGRIIGIIQE